MSTTPDTAENGPAGITAVPAVDQCILHDGKEYTTIKEGLAHILIPSSASTAPNGANGDHQAQSVFYNPIQQFNRDLSVLAIRVFSEEVIARKRREMAKSTKSRGAQQAKKRKRDEVGTERQDEARRTSKPGHNGRVQTESAPPSDGKAESVTKDTSLPRDQVRNEREEHGPRHPPFTVLDALSATGLRAVRYAHEIPLTTSVTANDLSPVATAAIKVNAKHNGLEEKITATTGNALAHMYNLICDPVDPHGRPKQSKKYDVIDLDPYGTASPFLDAAVQCVRDGGLLCVTCTDAGVWASNSYPEKAYSLYGGLSMKGAHSHEGGLRLILHAIASSAARYGLSMEPLLSLSIDFYARVFVRIRKSPAHVKFLAGTTMIVYNCDSGCGAYYPQLLAKNKLSLNKSGKDTFYKHVYSQAPSVSENCEQCGMKTHLAGPMYAGPLHSTAFIEQILSSLPSVSKETYATLDRIEGMLTTALHETLPPIGVEGDLTPPEQDPSAHDPSAVDQYPFFFIPSVLAKVIHCVTPHENALRGALRHLGYRVTRSHTKAGSIKTDAPWSVIWEVMREWARQKAPIREGALREGSPGWTIMRKAARRDGAAEEGEEDAGAADDVRREVVFDEKLGMERDKKKLVRYQINPRENWGPMNRARNV